MMETYKGKISGPILDRIDLWLEVPHVNYETLTSAASAEPQTQNARDKIVQARTLQEARLRECGVQSNAQMSSRDIEKTIVLNAEVKNILRQSSEKLNLSPRGYHRVIKVARTIADLDAAEHIEPHHMYEALQYRVKL